MNDRRKNQLIEQREQLTERIRDMQASLDRLNQKIDRYEKGLMAAEKRLQEMGASSEAGESARRKI